MFGIVFVLIVVLFGFVGFLFLVVLVIVMMVIRWYILFSVLDMGIVRLNVDESVKEDFVYLEIVNFYVIMINWEVIIVE